MLDLLNRHFVYTVDVGGTPHFIITGLYPPSSAATPPKVSPQQGSWRNIITDIVYVLAIVFLILLLVLLLQLRSYRRM
jgi:heme/copper-type cytochrome/quinol oxidase subunit 2